MQPPSQPVRPSHPPAAIPRVGASLSQQIRIARVICILAVIYVHAPPYGDRVPSALFGIDGIVWMVREMLGRSSVPLLSIVSGFLVVRLDSGSYTRRIRKKTMTLLVPLILWNFIALAAEFAQAGTLPPLASLPRLLIGLDGYPKLLPLYFLRDIFVCALILPILLFGVRTWPRLTIVLLLINATLDLDHALFLSSAIPPFFAVGLALGLGRVSAAPMMRRPRIWSILSLSVLFLLAVLPVVQTGAPPAWLANALLILHRAAGAVLFWLVAGAIMQRGVGRVLATLEPIIFFVFCSHPLIIGVALFITLKAGMLPGSPAALALFLLAPAVVVALSIVAVFVLSIVAPPMLRLLMAGKSPSRDQLRAMLAGGRTTANPHRTTAA